MVFESAGVKEYVWEKVNFCLEENKVDFCLEGVEENEWVFFVGRNWME